uniref:N-acyl amino acid synthase FeeM catalytic core domain-containing protein n=1 Tax=Bosea sp. NBC_00436 TaxID=2969620 RepID=A0A9E7ZZQ0_9HYPH
MTQVLRSGHRKLIDAVEQTLSKTEYRIASTASLQNDVARLRYDAYLREGAVTPSRSKILVDRFDQQPNSTTFAIFISGSLAASIRIHVPTLGRYSSPALDAFPELVGLVFNPDVPRILIDPNRFVIEASASHAYSALPFIVLRLPFLASEYLGAHYATATVRREHQAFYSRTLNYRPLVAPRPYPTLIKDLGLMLVNYQAEKSAVLDRYPFLAARPGEAEDCFRPLKNWLREKDADANILRPVKSPAEPISV